MTSVKLSKGSLEYAIKQARRRARNSRKWGGVDSPRAKRKAAELARLLELQRQRSQRIVQPDKLIVVTEGSEAQ